MQEIAERKAGIARLLWAMPSDATWGERIEIVKKQFGDKGTSKPSLKRILKAVEGVDSINFAPALLAGYKGRSATADVSQEAWDAFLSLVKKSFYTHRLSAIYDDIAEQVEKNGWHWPSRATIHRRWHQLDKLTQYTLRHGAAKAEKMVYQPHLRDISNLQALQWVEMDGRTLDLWAQFEDGTVGRPTLLAWVDRASHKALGIEIGKSENMQLVRKLSLKICDEFGIPANLATDNGSAFASPHIAGKVKHSFRGKHDREWTPVGLFETLGINVLFNKVKNLGAKIPESKFSKWSRTIDASSEFEGAFSGHNPGDKPDSKVVPVPIELVRKIYQDRVSKCNEKPGRRTQNARKGESYNQIFNRLLAGQTRRVMTPGQRYRASLQFEKRTVNHLGQIRVNGCVYGFDSEDGSQDKLLRYTGKQIMIGTDQSDYSAPAVVYDLDTRRQICGRVLPSLMGDFEDKEGARKSGREHARLRKLTREIEKSHDKDLTEFYKGLNVDIPVSELDDPRPKNVVQAQFNDPMQGHTSKKNKDDFWARHLPPRKERKSNGGNR